MAYWQLPLVLGVASVEEAVALGDRGVPFPAIVLPAPDPATPALKWAQLAIDTLAPLIPVGRNMSVKMTPAVSLDPCATESDSITRCLTGLALSSRTRTETLTITP